MTCGLLQVPLTCHFYRMQFSLSVLESLDHGSNSSLPRQYSGGYDGLRDLKFNFSPENRISVGRVNSCIDVCIFVMYLH